MLKYTETQVGFSEVPEEVTLCVNISGCPLHCEGCHSPHLQEDIGTPLTIKELSKLIAANSGITCISFMGGDSDPDYIVYLARWVRNNTELKICWYSGNRVAIKSRVNPQYFDYVKVGPYIKDRGGLDNPKTNQIFYKVVPINDGGFTFYVFEDNTFKFRQHKGNKKPLIVKNSNNETKNKSKSTN